MKTLAVISLLALVGVLAWNSPRVRQWRGDRAIRKAAARKDGDRR